MKNKKDYKNHDALYIIKGYELYGIVWIHDDTSTGEGVRE